MWDVLENLGWLLGVNNIKLSKFPYGMVECESVGV